MGKLRESNRNFRSYWQRANMTCSHCFPILIVAVLAASAQPRIAADGVLNSASYAPAGYLNSGVAQGSLFVIQGDDLGPGELLLAGVPLPSALAGVSVMA